MKSSNDLRTSLRAIDHKGYPAYKSLAGSYQFDRFILAIDHVQGDPFASPSSLHVEIFHRQAVSGKYGYPPRFYSCGCKNCPFCGRKRRVDGDNRSRGHPSSTSGSRYSEEI